MVKEPELYQLVDTVQRHRCTPGYCLKNSKTSSGCTRRHCRAGSFILKLFVFFYFFKIFLKILSFKFIFQKFNFPIFRISTKNEWQDQAQFTGESDEGANEERAESLHVRNGAPWIWGLLIDLLSIFSDYNQRLQSSYSISLAVEHRYSVHRWIFTRPQSISVRVCHQFSWLRNHLGTWRRPKRAWRRLSTKAWSTPAKALHQSLLPTRTTFSSRKSFVVCGQIL